VQQQLLLDAVQLMRVDPAAAAQEVSGMTAPALHWQHALSMLAVVVAAVAVAAAAAAAAAALFLLADFVGRVLLLWLAAVVLAEPSASSATPHLQRLHQQ
jgi:hypothetical protein